MSNGKGQFGPTDRNDQTGQSGPPSKLVPNILVGPNRNCSFHLMYQPKCPDFGLNGKRPGLHGLVLSCSVTNRLFCEAAACFIGHYDVARKSGSQSVPLCVFMSNEQISPPRVVCEQLSLHLLSLCMRILFKSIGHFRIPRTLTFKMRLSAQPFL